MAEKRINNIDEADIDTILAEDIDFEGILIFKKPLMIKGKFKGEIKSSGDLYIGKEAKVKANIEVEAISSKGYIKGDIIAHSKIELFSTSSIKGDINCPNLVIKSGSTLNGYCNMSGEPREKNEN